ncbi:hypothetical protein IKO70_04140 [bacterium]|nr:hypothetical protein [bacterium]
MSRKLQTLEEQYNSNPNLPNLIEYLEECKRESEWQTIIKVTEIRSGSETPEVHFYRGTALINLGKKKEGIKELKMVIAANPNHFAAKRELEKYADDEEAETSDTKANKTVRDIVIVKPALETNEHYNRLKLRNFAIAVVFIAGIIAALCFALKENPAKKYEEMLENPLASFTSLSFADYAATVRELKLADIREGMGDNIKKSILWMYALAILDFHITPDFEDSDIPQFRIYSTLVSDKGKELTQLVDSIENRVPPVDTEYFHKLDFEYPATKQKIAVLELDIPEKIEKSNLRESFYTALMLFRQDKFQNAAELNNRILEAFPHYELSQKLKVMISSKEAVAENKEPESAPHDLAILDNWKNLSPERYFFGEAKILLGEAMKDEKVVVDGFYSVCPGRTFCKEIAREFIRKNPNEAYRMALYMKEKKDTARDGDDIKLVLEASLANNDYSNCYFAYHELQQFFPDSVNSDIFKAGALCSEKNGYFEEAVAAYEQINEKDKNDNTTAKILSMKYRLTNEELYLNQLKGLVGKNPENLDMLYAFFDVLAHKNDIPEVIKLLEKIYVLEKDENKMNVINEFLKFGAVYQAVKTLEKLNTKEARSKLNEIYNRYMLFDKADSYLELGKNNDPIWIALREQIKMKDAGELEIVSKETDKLMGTLQRCEPALLYLKAEIYRSQGDKQRTFAMIDAMLECNRFYLPALAFASEITYYQGDLTKAKNGLNYILENEKFLSPGELIMHNYLILLNAEIMVNEGLENKIIAYMQKNLDKKQPMGLREVEIITDITEKLKDAKQKVLRKFLLKNYKFSVPFNER